MFAIMTRESVPQRCSSSVIAREMISVSFLSGWEKRTKGLGARSSFFVGGITSDMSGISLSITLSVQKRQVVALGGKCGCKTAETVCIHLRTAGKSVFGIGWG